MKWILGVLAIFIFSGCTKGSHIDDAFLGGVSLSKANSTLEASGTTVHSGSSITLTLTTRDSNGNIYWVPNSNPHIALSTSGGTSTGVFSDAINNQDGTYSITFSGVDSGTATTILATVDGEQLAAASAPQVTVTPGNYSLVNSYVTVSSGSVASSSSVNVTFHSYDVSGNALNSGGLAVTFSISGGTATGTFGATTDNGDGTYTATFTGITAGTATSITGKIAGQSVTTAAPTVAVSAGPATAIAVSSGDAQSGVVGTPLNSALVALVTDAHGNVVSGKTVDWSVTGTATLFSATSNSNSTGLASNTLSVGTVTGSYTVTATLHGSSTSTTFSATASPGLINNFLLSSVPASATAGTNFNITVTARDSYNNVKTDYVGVVHFSSSDPNSPTLPSNYTYISGDAGVKQFSFTLKTSGNQTISINQVAGGSPTATSSAINVTASAATRLVFITGPSSSIAGASIPTMLVRALDAYSNTASFTNNITLAIGTNAGGGTLSGTAVVAASSGSASFSGLSINKTGTGYTLVASASGLTSATSSTFDISAGSPASIAVVSGNTQTGTVGTALSNPLIAVVKDTNSNVVSGITVDWSSSVGNLSSSAVSTNSSGQSSNTFTLGTTAGTNTITATIRSTAISTSFTATGNAASTIDSIAWQTSPSTTYTASNSSAMASFSAKLLDAYGNVITSNSSTTVTVSLNQGTGSLGGTLTQTASSGVATFSAVTYTKAETIKITATENSGSKNISSSTITVSPNSASSAQSTIAASASSVSADGATSVDVTMTIKDAYGNPISGQTTTFAATGSGNTLTQPSSTTDSNGQAVGSITSSGQGSKTLSISAPSGLTGTTTINFISTAAVVANSSISATDTVVANGSAASTITITLRDALSNAVAGITPSFSATGSNNTYGSCSATDSSGVSTCTMTSTKAESKTVSLTGPISKTGNTITFIPGSAIQLVWSTQPSDGTAGTALSTQGVVAVKDANGNVITSGADATATISLSLQSGTGSLLGTTSVSAVAGIADFSGKGLKINLAGSKVIQASKADTSGSGGTSAMTSNSNSISITADSAVSLAVASFTSPSTAGSSHSVTITAQDAYGNTATSYRGTVHFTSSDSQAVLPSDYTFLSADNGVKSLSGFVLKTQGSTWSITGTDTTTSSITGSQTNITVNSSSADHISKVTGDSQSGVVASTLGTNLTVKVMDAYDNAVSGTVVTFSASNGSAGSATATTDSSGLASTAFTLGNTAGSNSLTVARQTTVLPGSPSSVTFTATGTPAAAATLTVTDFPSSVIAGSSNSLTVKALDAYSNTATGYTGTVHFTSIDGQSVLPSDYTFTSGSGQDNGQHTFSGVKLGTAGTQSITATDTVTSSITGTQSSITVSATTADHLALVTGDGQTAVAGAAVSTNPKVQVLDIYGNAVTGTTISFAVSSGGGSVGTASVNSDASGYASTTYTLGTTAGANTMTASRSGTVLPNAPTSITFSETGINGTATQLVYTTQPTGGVAPGVNLPAQPVIEIRDANGNTVTNGSDATANVTLSLSSGTGSISGTTTVAAVNGVATFSGISLDTQGSGKVLTATKESKLISGGAGSLTRTSNSFTINPPAPGAFTISSAVAGNSQVVLTWGSSSNVTTYTVKYGTSSGVYGTTVSTSATSPLTISSLTPGTTYYFQVQAVNVTATTSATSEASATPLSAFTISSVTVNSGNKLRVTYGSSTGATSYTVKFGTSSGSYSTTDSTSASSPYDIASLTGGTTYYVMVTAVNSSGSVNATAEASGIPIDAFTATSWTPAVGSTSIAFASTAGSSSYDLLYDTSSHTATQSYASSSTGVTSPATISSLSAGTTYYSRVRANNAYGSVVSTNELSGAVYQTFTLSIPFTSGTTSSYSFSNSSSFEFTSGGIARIVPAPLTDDSSTYFQSGTMSGVQWDSTGSYLRLDSTLNSGQFDSSWTPQWSSLIAYWKMDNNFNDSIGSYSATIVGSPTSSGPGKVGSQYGTFSSGNYGSIASPPALANSSFTISAWVYPTSSAAANKHILGYGTSTTDLGLHFGYTSTGTIRLGFYNDDLTTSSAYITNDLNRWVHIVATYDATTKSRTIYRDGIAVATGTASANFSGTGTMYIGQGLAANPFIGNIDELGIWSTALTSTQVVNIYNVQAAKYSGTFISRVMDSQATGSTNNTWSSLSLKTTLPFYKEIPAASESSSNYSGIAGGLSTDLIGLWRMNESSWNGTANEVIDSSGNGNHGVRTGAATTSTTGKFGNSGSFTATTDSVVTAAGSVLIPSTDHPLTISAWVLSYSIGTTGSGAIDNRIMSIHKGATASSTLAFGLGNTNKLMFYTSSTGAFISSTTTMTANVWTHVALTYNGTCFQMYINGAAAYTCHTASLVAGGSFGTRIGSYSSASSSFNGLIDDLGVWTRSLSATEIQQLYRRGVNRVRYQVRTCTASDCSDQAAATNLGWKGPDNTAQTSFSELYNTTNNVLGGTVAAGAPTMTFSNFGSLSLTANRYFQYRAYMESDDANTGCTYNSAAASCSPEIQYAGAGPTRYDSSAPTITTSAAAVTSAFETLDASAFTEVLGSNGCSSGVKYSLSHNGSSYYYWNGSTWASSTSAATANDASTIAAHISTFPTTVGTGTLRVKAYMQSSGTSQCELDSLTITGKKY